MPWPLCGRVPRPSATALEPIAAQREPGRAARRASAPGVWLPVARGRGRRRLRAADAVDRDRLAGEQRKLVEAPVGVDLGDRRDPRLPVAARVGDVVHAGVGELAVVAGDVAAHDRADLGPRAAAAAPGASSFSTVLASMICWKKKSELRLSAVAPLPRNTSTSRRDRSSASAGRGRSMYGVGHRADVRPGRARSRSRSRGSSSSSAMMCGTPCEAHRMTACGLAGAACAKHSAPSAAAHTAAPLRSIRAT